MVAAAIEDGGAHGEEVALRLRGHVHAAAHPKPLRLHDGDRGLAEVAVGGELGPVLPVLPQHRGGSRPTHRHPAAKVERVAHPVVAGPHFDHAAPEMAHVVHGRLQGAVIGADDVGVVAADGDADGGAGMEFVLGVPTPRLVPEGGVGQEGGREQEGTRCGVQGAKGGRGCGGATGARRARGPMGCIGSHEPPAFRCGLLTDHPGPARRLPLAGHDSSAGSHRSFGFVVRPPPLRARPG